MTNHEDKEEEAVTLNDIELALANTPWARRWTNPDEPAWYSWMLGARNQGPRLEVRLVCPIIPRDERPAGKLFKVVAIRSPGTKQEKLIKQLFRVRDVGKVESRVIRAWNILRAAPDCPMCRSACYPNSTSSGRWFWSCCKFPVCLGSRKAIKNSKRLSDLI